MTLQNAINIFLDDVLIYNAKDTYISYSLHFKQILLFFGDVDLFSITEDKIKDFVVASKLKNNSNNTINKRLDLINRILKKYDIIIPIKRLRIIYKSFNYLTYYEVVKLLNYIDHSKLSLQNKLILRLFLDTGIRIEELVNIKVINIDLINNCILLSKTKTNKERYVFFTTETRDNFLIPYLKLYSSFNLINIKKSGVRSMFKRVGKILGFKNFSPHMMRHTYATILVNNNTNLEFIRCTLGHSSLNTTKRYLHYNQEQLFKTYKEQFKIKE